MTRLREEEHADLRHVRPGRDVHEVLLGIHVEWIVARELVQGGVDLREVPRIGNVERVQDDLRFRRHGSDVARHRGRESVRVRRMQEFEPVDDEVLLLAKRHRGTPALPPRQSLARGVHGDSEHSDGDCAHDF